MTEDERFERAQSLDALTEVVGHFAHDLGNLLATIVLNLGFIEKKCTDPTAVWFARSALRAADRGNDLANRLLAFAGKQRLTCVPTDLPALISGLRGLLSRTAGPAVELILSAEEEIWPASVDRDQLEFALVNLVENARDAMPQGGRLTLELTNARITRPTSDVPAGDYAVIALEDTGETLSDVAIERAFEPFFSTRRGPEHPGLGLSVVLGIAKAHGGIARLTRAAGGGCRVEIYLPRATEAETQAAPDPETAPQPEGPAAAAMTVLAVDDDPDLLAVVQEGLASLGCNVLVADGGSAALAVLSSHPSIELLIVDVSMGGMSGLELIRRARELRPGLKALVMTGGAAVPGGSDADRGFSMLRKPFRVADLARAIAAVMSGDETR